MDIHTIINQCVTVRYAVGLFLLALILFYPISSIAEVQAFNEVPQNADDNQVVSDITIVNTRPAEASKDKKNFSFLMTQRNKQENSAADSSQAINVSLGLIFILLLIFSLAWFMRKMGYSNISGQGELKILATLNLGQKEKIALIQVGQQQLLIGVTANQINTLHVLDEILEAGDSAMAADAGFAKKLAESLGKPSTWP